MMGSSHAQVAAQILEKSQTAVFGIPDSTLTELLVAFSSLDLHQVAANEGSAVSLAIGYWLETKIPAHVYMQNSGLLNAGNPLMALAQKRVYDIPLSLTIGWRGQPDSRGRSDDEPQHLETGLKTPDLLKALGFDVKLIQSSAHYLETLTDLVEARAGRVALLVPRGIFDFRSEGIPFKEDGLRTDAAIQSIHEALKLSHAMVSGTGYMSRDLAHARSKESGELNSSFYLVGGMGHVASVAAGISMGGRPGRICAIEGDGGALMHLGGLAALGQVFRTPIDLLLIRNGVHASVGGQPVLNPSFDFEKFLRACGILDVETVSSSEALDARLGKLAVLGLSHGTANVVETVEPGSREAAPRPSGFREIARKFR